MTVHPYFKTWRSVNPKNVKNFESFFKCSRKTIKRYDETGSHEARHRNVDSELPLLQRISSLELPGSEIAAQKNASQSSSNRHISTSTVQRRLREQGLHDRIAAKKMDTNKKKRITWAKKHKQWTLDWWKFVLWSGVQS